MPIDAFPHPRPWPLYASLEKLNDFKLKYHLITPDAHGKIAGEIVASLAYMERVRNAVRAHGPLQDLPEFVESDHGAVRTQRELRWKVRHRYPGLFSLSMVGLKLLADEVRARVLRRTSPLQWSIPAAAAQPEAVSGSTEEG